MIILQNNSRASL